jgi:hypothetical protein
MCDVGATASALNPVFTLEHVWKQQYGVNIPIETEQYISLTACL